VEGGISVRDLCVVRGGARVLDGISLDIVQGTVTGLLGPSGSGKSTLMRSIVGVQRIDSGAVRVLGVRAGSHELRRRVAYMTQAPSVYEDITVGENLHFFQRVLEADRARVREVLREVALDGFDHRVVATLSGGERARVSLATALLAQPEVLVLDEPTVGLDPLLRRELWTMFKGLAERGATLLVSSHVMDEAARCDALVLLREGTVLATGSVDQILRDTGAPDMDGAFLALIERPGA
jgi:ABC-2 type transport system ATP-binding protein